jgi:hypothetical protein
MHPRFAKVAAPLWAALYLVIFRGLGAIIFITLIMSLGVWQATLVLIFLYGVWSMIFYLILLQTEAFEHFRDFAGRFLKDKRGKIFIWMKLKLFPEGKMPSVPPYLILFVFAVESPLTGVPIVRYAYPKDKFLIGLFWIWLGSIVEVTTWYLPIYGGGLSVIRAAMPWLLWR